MSSRLERVKARMDAGVRMEDARAKLRHAEAEGEDAEELRAEFLAAREAFEKAVDAELPKVPEVRAGQTAEERAAELAEFLKNNAEDS